MLWALIRSLTSPVTHSNTEYQRHRALRSSQQGQFKADYILRQWRRDLCKAVVEILGLLEAANW